MINSDQKTSPKKVWQTPTVEILARGYVEGGHGPNVHESTALTTAAQASNGQGHPGKNVSGSKPPGFRSSSWTAANMS